MTEHSNVGTQEALRVPCALGDSQVTREQMDMVIAYGHLDRLIVRGQSSPCRKTLQLAVNWSDGRLDDALQALVTAGWIRRRKVPYRYGEGKRDFSAKWLYELNPNTSIEDELGNGYVEVPLQLTRGRGAVLATRAYVLWAEQQRRDGGPSTTSTEDARKLGCSTATVRRLRKVAGISPLIDPVPGRFLGLLRLRWWSHTQLAFMELYEQHTVFTPAKQSKRLMERHMQLRLALDTLGYSVEGIEVAALERISSYLEEGEAVPLAALTRFLEVRFARELVTSRHYVGRLENRFASRMRGLGVTRGKLAQTSMRRTVRATSGPCPGCGECDDGFRITGHDAQGIPTMTRCTGRASP